MRKVRWLSVAVFLLAIAYFVFYNIDAITNTDESGPVIEMADEKIYVSVKDNEEALLAGVTATDKRDGDVSDSLVIESISSFTDDGTRYVNYAAFDSDNHVSKAARVMEYTDFQPARFTLKQPLRFPIATASTIDYLGDVYAEDCLDGDVSDDIHFAEGSNIIADTAGNYKVELVVTNSAGSTTTLPVTVTIYDSAKDSAAPKLQLTEYLVYTKKGTAIDPKTYLESVTYRTTEYALTEGRGTFGVDTSEMTIEERDAFHAESPAVSYDKITISDRVDYEKPGVYEIEYSLADDKENTGHIYLIVVVEE